MTIDEMIAVLQAYKDCKAIQERVRDCGSWWDMRRPQWDFHEYDYRIKPEPREWVLDSDILDRFHMHPSYRENVKVREVIE